MIIINIYFAVRQNGVKPVSGNVLAFTVIEAQDASIINARSQKYIHYAAKNDPQLMNKVSKRAELPH